MDQINFYLNKKVTKNIINMSILMLATSLSIIFLGVFLIDPLSTRIIFICIGSIGFLFFGKVMLVYISRLKKISDKPMLIVSDSKIIDHMTIFINKEISWLYIKDIGLIEYNKSYFIGIHLKNKEAYKENLKFWQLFNIWFNRRSGFGDLTLQISCIDETPEKIFNCLYERYKFVNNI